jgi:cephalosporin-C deacetylase-like acetyl esterase
MLIKNYCISVALAFCLSIFQFHASSQSLINDSLRINSLPSIPFLPDPLVLDEGGKNIPVKTAAQWQQKKQWIRDQYQYWVSGSVPQAPKTFQVKVLSDTVVDRVELRMVELSFGPNNKAKMTLELMIPPSSKPLPVFMTQWSHRGWAQIAVRRGYMGCVYAGADSKDDTKEYNEIFSGYDFAKLMKRAWGASRVIDYLYTLPQTDTARIALTGHSRNGKQSLMAAAFDSRIKAVVSSSGGTGAESTFRFSDERFNSESLEEITRNFPKWFNPRLRLFAGREEKLPVDQNSLMSMIAPRGLMMVSAVTEEQGNPWGIGQSYASVKKVYHLLHADSNVAVHFRGGRHQHSARDVENFIDFFDYVFKRSSIAPENKLYYTYSFDKWKQLSGEKINPLQFPVVSASKRPTSFNRDSIRKQIKWLLGNEPFGVAEEKNFSPVLTRNASYEDDYLEEVIGEQPLSDDIKKMPLGPYHALGDDLWGAIYFPASAVSNNTVKGKLPLVIYLHGYSYATGYHRRSLSIIRNFTEKGFAVLALDMVGFGTRSEEAANFYNRYPHWSMLGKMVTDTRGVIADACNRMPFIDSSNIFLAGYSLGGTVALITAALDDRVKGTAVVNAFSSLRNDNVGTEGIRHYSHLHGLLPRLGFFVGDENRIPIDFDEVMEMIAPRSLFVSAQEKDRNHSSESVRQLIESATAETDANHKQNRVTMVYPDQYSPFPDSLQKQIADWMVRLKGENRISNQKAKAQSGAVGGK